MIQNQGQLFLLCQLQSNTLKEKNQTCCSRSHYQVDCLQFETLLKSTWVKSCGCLINVNSHLSKCKQTFHKSVNKWLSLHIKESMNSTQIIRYLLTDIFYVHVIYSISCKLVSLYQGNSSSVIQQIQTREATYFVT